MVVAMLVDRGLLCYDEKISSYWPEFSQHGKEGITLADVLRHESGVARFGDHVFNNEDILRENIKNNSIGKVIENCKPEFPETANGISSKRAYHSTSRGFILNEVCRRVDPQKRF